MPNSTNACIQCPSSRCNNIGTSKKYTGNRAAQLIHGATKIVTNRSFAESIVRAAITPGIAHAYELNKGRNAFPLKPAFAITPSIRNAALAI